MPGPSCAQKAGRISLSGTNSPRVLVTRPLPQGERTAEKLQAMGYTPVLAPMLRIEPVTPPILPDFGSAQAVLVTSRNGIDRFAALTAQRDVALLAVGDRTAAEAHKVGFSSVQSASGDGNALLAMAKERLSPDGGPIIHIRGRHAAVEFDGLKALGYDFHDVIAYEALDHPELRESACSPTPAAALVYSRRTTQALVDALQNAGLDPTRMTFIGISDAALTPLLASKARVHVAKTPDEPALLAALTEIIRSGLKN